MLLYSKILVWKSSQFFIVEQVFFQKFLAPGCPPESSRPWSCCSSPGAGRTHRSCRWPSSSPECEAERAAEEPLHCSRRPCCRSRRPRCSRPQCPEWFEGGRSGPWRIPDQPVVHILEFRYKCVLKNFLLCWFFKPGQKWRKRRSSSQPTEQKIPHRSPIKSKSEVPWLKLDKLVKICSFEKVIK